MPDTYTPSYAVNPKKVVKKIVETYRILVIGSGGTGTFLLKELNHYFARNKKIASLVDRLVIADGDTVDEKNLDRQCFTGEDIGRNKALLFADVLNDAYEDLNPKKPLRWEAFPSYLTTKEHLLNALGLIENANEIRWVGLSYRTGGSELSFVDYEESTQTLYIRIPIIVGCVDNDACRVLCEELFSSLENCIYYDSGSEFSTGEVVYAHKINGKVLSGVKSEYFTSILDGDLRPVTALSCEELNQSAPQHFLTNMTGAHHLLRGLVNLFTDCDSKPITQRISGQLGYIFFDSFAGISEFTSYEVYKASAVYRNVI